MDSTTKIWRPARPMGLARALNKAGYGSRACTVDMVRSGRIQVGGQVVTDPLAQVGPDSDIALDGQPLGVLTPTYMAFHKPARVVSTPQDGPGRPIVSDFLPTDIPGLQPVGRMDAKTTGLILIANDPEWIRLVTGRVPVEQEYRVQIGGELSDVEIGVMTAGVHLPKMGVFRPVSLQVVEIMNGHTIVHITLREGKVRQLRRMLTTLRHKVDLVRRVRIGPVKLGDLAAGKLRMLDPAEVATLRESLLPVRGRGSRKTDM